MQELITLVEKTSKQIIDALKDYAIEQRAVSCDLVKLLAFLDQIHVVYILKERPEAGQTDIDIPLWNLILSFDALTGFYRSSTHNK